jgi:WD40 repeat protein
MPRRSAQLPSISAKVRRAINAQNRAEIELGELEREINENRDRPLSIVLKGVIDRVLSLTDADGAAIALRDAWGVVCRASAGEAPDVGSRLHPESSLTRECFESGQVMICEDTEEDSRVKLAAKSLRLRSAVVVPVQAQGSVLGVVEVLSSRASAFTTAHIAALQHIARLLVPIFQSEEATHLEERVGKRRAWTAIAGAALFLALLLLLFEFHHRSTKAPSATANPPASGPAKPAEAPTISRGAPETGESQSLKTPDRSPADVSSPAASSSSSPLSFQPRARPAKPAEAAPGSKPLGTENLGTGVAPPALVIEGAPPEAQIFVDDRLTASTGSDGQAKISTLSPGQHRLRVTVNGYQDYEKDIDLLAGQTSSVAAKLEPFAPPVLTEEAKAPSLEFRATIPRLAKPPVPEFVLDRTLKAHSGWVTGVAFSADGQRLASGSSDQTVKFWDVPTGQETSTVAAKIQEVQALAFSRDGHWLAAENSINTVTLWDAATGREVRTFRSNKPLGVLGSSWVYSIAFSPDGRLLASGVDDKTIRLWDVETGRSVRDLGAARRSVIYIAFSPDGRWLASGSNDKTIKIWEVATGKEIQTLRGHKKNVYAVAFSSNGRYLASASADKSVKLWDVTTGREIHTLTGHGSDVSSIAFSPDSRWLASGSWDKTIKIWDVQTGREVRTLEGNTHHVYTVAFDSRGRWLASGSEDGTIKLWRLDQR